MHCVVDSNFLRSADLREFLAESIENVVVLPDYVVMEAYKSESLDTLFRSMEIVSDFPNQMVVLKGTQELSGLTAAINAPLYQLVDQEQTHGLPVFFKALGLARSGDEHCLRQAREYQRVAREFMTTFEASLSGLGQAFGDLANMFDPDERKAIRSDDKYSPEIIEKIMWTISETAGILLRDHPSVTKMPVSQELSRTLIFRTAVVAVALSLDWIRTGGASNAKSSRHRNDFVDCLLIVYASYFDGILTSDKKLRRIYDEAFAILEILDDVSGANQQ
jgi:hypothetical protein